ncbi:lytic transglycosylase domain-containing protein [Achromobacter sp. GD03932]|uniref:lytic transglycosylase domain-containing protein n=1 Tax=Achromobacter sp. GD03932 TaxID=2975407 RepID=UPI002446A0D2|nr:lytic transglycosylase domain-containing protein [Achromobacter sp. GD03932]MDH1299671.1 lytic transglycosylase domain-containing protein [Achromobacter sp. GD03932]
MAGPLFASLEDQYQLPAGLLDSVWAAESGRGKNMLSPAGAQGHFQFMPPTAEQYGVKDPNDLTQSATGAARMLRDMIDQTGGLDTALAAYNWGIGNLQRQGLQKAPAETRNYIEKVSAGMAQANDPWTALNQQFSQQQPATQPEQHDPWAALGQQFAMPSAAAPGVDVKAAQGAEPVSGAATSAPYRVDMSQEDAVRIQGQAPHTGVLGAIEGLGARVRKAGEGFAQGFGDVPVGVAQASLHDGQRILGEIDGLLGTSLADTGAGNVAARDAEIAQREADYQAATPGSFAAGVGRVGGNLAFSALGGGGRALTAPIMVGTQLGARALPMAPRLGGLLGASTGSGLLGAGYGAVAPVTAGDYDERSTSNMKMGGLLGAATPALGQLAGATGRYIGNNVRAAVAPFTEKGREQIARNIVNEAASRGARRADAGALVSGSTPTLAEISGNPGVANLQRTMRDLNPAPFVEREEANALARMDALNGLRGSADDLAAAVTARDTAAASDYLSTHIGIPVANTEYAALKRTPAFQSAFAEAERMAKNSGGSVETKVANRALANRGGSIGRPQTYVSGVGLQRIKTALDDQITAAKQAGERAKAANVQQVQGKLLALMDREIPGYAEARSAYAHASKGIDAMHYLQGMNLTDAQGNITLAKVQNALSALRKTKQKPGLNPAKAVTGEQENALIAIRDDLLRAARVGSGRSMGSATAQNLATQNMLAQALPGKAGALAGKAPAGSIGTVLGSGAGYLLGGPLGAAAGGAVGGSLGRTASSVINTNNEAIQDAIIRILLNEGGSGLATLQSAAGGSRPLLDMGGVQRLLYPTVDISAGLGLGRTSVPANGR